MRLIFGCGVVGEVAVEVLVEFLVVLVHGEGCEAEHTEDANDDDGIEDAADFWRRGTLITEL